MLGETQNQFSLTRAALSTGGAQKQVLQLKAVFQGHRAAWEDGRPRASSLTKRITMALNSGLTVTGGSDSLIKSTQNLAEWP